MPSTRSTQPRLVTEPTTKPILAPPRHSSTPTCTRSIGCCAWEMGTAKKLAASAARRSERRMKKTPAERCDADGEQGPGHFSFYATTSSIAPKKRGPLSRASDRSTLMIASAVTAAMMPVAMGEAHGLELEAGDAGGDVQPGLALHADRL